MVHKKTFKQLFMFNFEWICWKSKQSKSYRLLLICSSDLSVYPYPCIPDTSGKHFYTSSRRPQLFYQYVPSISMSLSFTSLVASNQFWLNQSFWLHPVTKQILKIYAFVVNHLGRINLSCNHCLKVHNLYKVFMTMIRFGGWGYFTTHVIISKHH